MRYNNSYLANLHKNNPLLLFLVSFLIAILAIQIQGNAQDQKDDNVVRAEKFVIENSDGSRGMTIKSEDSGSGIVISNKQGDSILKLTSFQDSVGLSITSGGPKVMIGTTENVSTVSMFDKESTLRIRMRLTNNGPKITMMDKEGNVQKEIQYTNSNTNGQNNDNDGKSPEENGGTTSQKTAPEPALTVGANKLYSDFNSNVIKANKKYMDKWIILTGNVKAVKQDPQGYFVKMKAKGRYLSHKCYFPENKSEELSDLTAGQYVQILGKVTSGGDRGAILKKCRIKEGEKGTQIPDSFLKSRIYVRSGVADFDEDFTPSRFRQNMEENISAIGNTQWKRIGKNRFLLQASYDEQDKTSETYFDYKKNMSKITKVHVKGTNRSETITDWEKILRFIEALSLNEKPETEDE